MEFYKNLKSGTKAELKQRFPAFVTFRNLDDPNSLVPLQFDGIEKFFGQGIKLEKVTIEITDDPVTWEIETLINRFGGGSGHYDRSMFQRKDEKFNQEEFEKSLLNTVESYRGKGQ